MSSASRWLQSRYRGRRHASRANGSPISARSCDERPTKSRRSSAVRCPSGANSNRRAASESYSRRACLFPPAGRTYFSRQAGLFPQCGKCCRVSLANALFGYLDFGCIPVGAQKGCLRRGMEAGAAEVARRFARRRLAPGRVGVAVSRSAREHGWEEQQAQPRAASRAELTLGSPASTTARQAGLRQARSASRRKKNFCH